MIWYSYCTMIYLQKTLLIFYITLQFLQTCGNMTPDSLRSPMEESGVICSLEALL